MPVALGQAAWLSPGLPEEGAMELLGNSSLCACCPLQLLSRLGVVNSPLQGSLQQLLPWLPAPHRGHREKWFRRSVFASVKVSLGRSLRGCRVMGEGSCCHGKNIQVLAAELKLILGKGLKGDCMCLGSEEGRWRPSLFCWRGIQQRA